MHRVAEEGIAAHWRYKEGRIDTRGDDKDQKRFAWLRQLMEWQRDLKDPTEFIENGEDRPLRRRGLRLHAEGRRQGAAQGRDPDRSRVRDSLRGRQPLLGRARQRAHRSAALRAAQRRHRRDHHLAEPEAEQGLAEVRHHLVGQGEDPQLHALRASARSRRRSDASCSSASCKKYGVSFNKTQKSGDIDRALARAQGGVVRRSVDLDRLRQGPAGRRRRAAGARGASGARLEAEPPPTENPVAQPGSRASRGDRTRRASKWPARTTCWCASPSAARRCRAIRSSASSRAGAASPCTRSAARRRVDQDPDRRVEVEWDGKLKQPRPVSVQVVCADKPGSSRRCRSRSTTSGVNISQANCRSTDDHKAINTFTFAVQDLDQLKTVMRALQKISGVFQVSRM